MKIPVGSLFNNVFGGSLQIPQHGYVVDGAVAEWLAALRANYATFKGARAVLALVEAKVREAVVKRAEEECFTPATIDNLERIVSRVMGREVAP